MQLLSFGVRLNTMIAYVVATLFGFFFELSREKTASTFTTSLAELRVLKGIVPMCCVCRDVRQQDGRWARIDSLLCSPGQTEFSHTYCDACLRNLDTEE